MTLVGLSMLVAGAVAMAIFAVEHIAESVAAMVVLRLSDLVIDKVQHSRSRPSRQWYCFGRR